MPALVVVFVHGLHGTHDDYVYFERSLREHFERSKPADRNTLFVLRSAANNYQTHDGIKKMGKRLLEEVTQFITGSVVPEFSDGVEGEDSVYLSVVGHSLGGLISRYMLRYLFHDSFIQKRVKELSSARLNLVPLSYMTIASPHLGSRRPMNVDSPYDIVMSSIVNLICMNIGQTGKELILKDFTAMNEEQQEPGLLHEMSREGGEFIKALKLFSSRTTVAHLQDLTVPYGSSLLLPHHKFAKGSEIEKLQVLMMSGFSSDYRTLMNDPVDAPVIMSEKRVRALSERSSEKGFLAGRDVEYTEEILTSLEKLQWRRLLLDFNLLNPFSRLFVHPAVIGKSFPIVQNIVKVLGEQCTDMLVRILLLDYQNEINRV